MTAEAALRPHTDLLAFSTEIFRGYGLPPDGAATVADCLVEADLRGVHSHGVSRVPIYTERLARGLFNPQPAISVQRTGAATLLIDGDNGMGAVVGVRAADEAIAVAREAGAGVAAVRRSNHFGIAAYYILRMVGAGMVAVVASNAPPTMAPWGGRTARFGTNPLSYGVPAANRPPIVADMAASVVARGKIILAARRGEAIPEGWALDAEGRPTTDPEAALDGVVLPFGGPKGSAFALLVDVLCGALSGAAFGRAIPDFYRDLERIPNLGHVVIALDVGRFMDPAAFAARVDALAEDIKGCPPAAGVEEVMLPGEIEYHLAERRRREGIPLASDVVAGLLKAARPFGIVPPASLTV